MEKPRLSRFPHYAWLGYWEHVRPDTTTVTVCRRQTSFYLGYMGRGHASVRWIRRGRERRFTVDRGAVRLSPADGERHTLISSHDPGNSFYMLAIPKSQVDDLTSSEGIAQSSEWHHQMWPDDAVLKSCLAYLSVATPSDENGADGRKDEVARRLMLRLLETQGGGVPSWGGDVSVFDRHTLGDLMAYIDDHLKPGLLLIDMGPLVGLSPSHFARKFRNSTGMSLHRCVNYRRIQASFAPLRANNISLAHLSIELGFASQSHFTRLFSELTGVTPAKYRKQIKPGVAPGVPMAKSPVSSISRRSIERSAREATAGTISRPCDERAAAN